MLSGIYRGPDETFELGRRIGKCVRRGDLILLTGGLGAGKTLLTKGILDGLGYDPDEVTSPSFALVNLYQTAGMNVYHLDLWRIDPSTDASFAVGLPELADDPDAVVLIEWAERLNTPDLGMRTIHVTITGEGDAPRSISIRGLDEC